MTTVLNTNAPLSPSDDRCLWSPDLAPDHKHDFDEIQNHFREEGGVKRVRGEERWGGPGQAAPPQAVSRSAHRIHCPTLEK